MKKTQQSKKEIYLIVYVFISIVLLAMISKTFSFYQMHDINEKSVETYQYALNVSNSALSIKADIYKIHRDMKDIVLTDSNEELLKLIKEMEITQKSVYSSFDIIEKNIATKYGLTLLKETKDMFEHCQSVRDAIISLINSNSIAQAIEIAKDSEPRHMQKLESCVSNLYDYAYNRAAYLKTVSDENFKKMLIMDFLTALLLLFLFFLLYIIRLKESQNIYTKMSI